MALWLHWMIALLGLYLHVVRGQVCRKSPCEYTFTIRHDRTMIYRPPAGKAYKVGLNGTRLQVIESTFLKAGHSQFGRFADVDDTITADGVTRNIITVNGQFPGPSIEVEEGVQVVVKVTNKMRTDGVTVHWHGIYHKGGLWMDGAAQITQCPIAPFQSFTYRFEATPGGTHWYHAHNGLQRIDGLYGMLIIHPKMAPSVQNSFNLLVSDWMHEEGNNLEITNPYSQEKGDKGAGEHLHTHPSVREYAVDGVENAGIVYTSGLINGRGRFDGKKLPLSRFNVTSPNTYRFRTVNAGGEFSYAISVDSHPLTVVALDGIEVVAYQVDDVVVAPGETLDFEISANQSPMLYWIRARTLRDSRSDGKVREVLAILEYDGMGSTGDPTTSQRRCTQSDPCKTLNCPFPNYPAGFNRQCVTIAEMRTTGVYKNTHGLESEDVDELFLNAGFAWGSSINARKFVQPTAPLYQKDRLVVDCEEVCTDFKLGCVCTGTYSIVPGRTIQLVMSNVQPGAALIAHHPMHLHGHNFAVLKVGFGTYNSSGFYTGQTSHITCTTPTCREPRWNGSVPAMNLDRPPLKNTVVVPARGYVVVRFKADNPGRWLFHCHAVTHNVEGMMALIKEGDDRQVPPVPKGFPTCDSFDWSAEEYRNYKTGGGISEKPSDKDQDNDGDGRMMGALGMISIDVLALVGLIVAGVFVGAILACLIFTCVYCTRRCTSQSKEITAM